MGGGLRSLSFVLNLRGSSISGSSCALGEAWDKKGQGVQYRFPFLFFIVFNFFEPRVQVQCQSKLGNIYFIHLKDFIQYLDEKIIHLVRIGSG